MTTLDQKTVLENYQIILDYFKNIDFYNDFFKDYKIDNLTRFEKVMNDILFFTVNKVNNNSLKDLQIKVNSNITIKMFIQNMIDLINKWTYDNMDQYEKYVIYPIKKLTL